MCPIFKKLDESIKKLRHWSDLNFCTIIMNERTYVCNNTTHHT
ncbi:hypothetical protein VDIAB_110613 [Vibrio diabolicus]|nr:hypothetical protein VDIAB_110613 [Vibrio diabolicus]